MIVANFTAKTKKSRFFSPYPPQNTLHAFFSRSHLTLTHKAATRRFPEAPIPPQNSKTRLQVNLQPRNNIKIFYTLIFTAPPLYYAAATAFAV